VLTTLWQDSRNLFMQVIAKTKTTAEAGSRGVIHNTLGVCQAAIKNRSFANDYFTKGKEKCHCCDAMLTEFHLDCNALEHVARGVSQKFGLWQNLTDPFNFDEQLVEGLFLMLTEIEKRGGIDVKTLANELMDSSEVFNQDGEEESA
jgi:hypothetical protein